MLHKKNKDVHILPTKKVEVATFAMILFGWFCIDASAWAAFAVVLGLLVVSYP